MKPIIPEHSAAGAEDVEEPALDWKLEIPPPLPRGGRSGPVKPRVAAGQQGGNSSDDGDGPLISPQLTDAEIAASFTSGKWAEQFPPILDVQQAAKLAIVPVGTIYDWSSRGLLANCATRVGKHLRIFRDRFLKALFN